MWVCCVRIVRAQSGLVSRIHASPAVVRSIPNMVDRLVSGLEVYLFQKITKTYVKAVSFKKAPAGRGFNVTLGYLYYAAAGVSAPNHPAQQ